MSIVRGSDPAALWEECHRLNFTHHMAFKPQRSGRQVAYYRVNSVISKQRLLLHPDSGTAEFYFKQH